MTAVPRLEDIRRTQIIDAAAGGAANITMRDIARAAGVSNGGLIHYFPSKEEIFKAGIYRAQNLLLLRTNASNSNPASH
jgi:AcrR family transcriptional regulator